MFCNACGKKNPDDAHFCAYCGAALVAPQQAALPIESEFVPEAGDAPAPQAPPPKAAAEAAPEAAADPDSPYRRPGSAPKFKSHVYGAEADPEKTVRPLTENPAQPGRPEAKSMPRPAPHEDEIRPRPARPDVSKLNLKRPAPPVGKAITSAGEAVTPPSRKPPVRRPPIAAKQRPSNNIPQRKKSRRQSDLFFEDLELPEDTLYDEIAEEDRLARRIKSAIALLFLAAVAVVVGWLFLTGSGQVFRASLGMGAPASAYKQLGDQARAGGQLKRAADAYYNALKLDPENYQYALLVGSTQDLIGEKEKAIAAYQLCITLRDTAVEPYRLLADLYEQMGQDGLAQTTRQAGYEKTGDSSLLTP